MTTLNENNHFRGVCFERGSYFIINDIGQSIEKIPDFNKITSDVSQFYKIRTSSSLYCSFS